MNISHQCLLAVVNEALHLIQKGVQQHFSLLILSFKTGQYQTQEGLVAQKGLTTGEKSNVSSEENKLYKEFLAFYSKISAQVCNFSDVILSNFCKTASKNIAFVQ